MEGIMEKNFGIKKENPSHRCWKHSIDVPDGLKQNIPIITMHKNPYLWVESICMRNTVDWIKTQTEYPANKCDDDRLKLGNKGLNVVNLAKTYLHWYNTWLTISSPDTFTIRYEDLLDDRERLDDILTSVQKYGSFKRRNVKKWIIPTMGSVGQSKDYNKKRQEYYKRMAPIYLTNYQISKINEVLPDNLFESLRYRKL